MKKTLNSEQSLEEVELLKRLTTGPITWNRILTVHFKLWWLKRKRALKARLRTIS